ncbi:hypothetical protein E3E11_05500 [Oecophyllibacter saccharovorans]|uniref:Uncharacterized protein n=1 Tax=Oecophyllibacter saccharovorans TaxID=2558360 RepID=A0A506ULJ7_9PROT|nr:hypothetical protein [Oecophyllibacter saccharovorans]QDH15392.1 hypothetical protein E3E11_05500 [Oecophyllibacter saccharovorans]TPW34224.1 hypothetical protein E3202_06855 [Oecophyllibacter saccharovorans]
MPKALTPSELQEGRRDIAERLSQVSQTEAREFMLPVRAVAYFFPKLTEEEQRAPVWPGATLPNGQGHVAAFPPLDWQALRTWLETHGAGFKVEPNVEGDYPDAQVIFVRN